MVIEMDKLILFLNAFLSYFLVFVIIVALVMAAVFIGIRLRKSKNAKEALAEAAVIEEQK